MSSIKALFSMLLLTGATLAHPQPEFESVNGTIPELALDKRDTPTSKYCYTATHPTLADNNAGTFFMAENVFGTGLNLIKTINYISEQECRNQCVKTAGCKYINYFYQNGNNYAYCSIYDGSRSACQEASGNWVTGIRVA